MKSTTKFAMNSWSRPLAAAGVVATVSFGAGVYVLTVPVALADESASVHSAQGAPVAHAAPASPGAAKDVTLYTCPMHPQIIEDHPGTCPICGMDLVPKLFPSGTRLTAGPDAGKVMGAAATVPVAPPVSAESAMPAVTVAPLTLKYMNVVMAPATLRALAPSIRSVGYVALDEDRVVHVHARASGWVRQLSARAVGDPVTRGQVLLSLYSPELLAAQKDFVVAEKSGMGTLAAAARERLRLLDFSDAQIAALSRSGTPQVSVPILAPQSGYLSALNLREGMYITPDLDLFTIADNRRVWVQIAVLARDMSRVAVGQTATMTIDGLPGKSWTGTVSFIYPELDPKTRTLTARVAFENPDGLLKPNQFANVTIHTTPADEVLSVPSSAVIPSPHGDRVVVKTASGAFRPVPVKVGLSAEGFTQILQGLSLGDSVVASGQFLLDSESALQASFERMTGQAAPADVAAPAEPSGAGHAGHTHSDHTSSGHAH